MPMALQGLALCPFGDIASSAEPSSSAPEAWLHQWPPIGAASKAELARCLTPVSGASEAAHEYARWVTDMLQSDEALNEPSLWAVPDRDHPLVMEIDSQSPGLFQRLCNEGCIPHLSVGDCLSPEIDEGSIVFSHHDREIRKGDLVAFAAHGIPTLLCKVYLGTMNGRAYFWCNKPAMLYIFDLAHLIHVSRIAWVKRPGEHVIAARDIDFSIRLSPAAAKVKSWALNQALDAPKATSVFNGLLQALQEIQSILIR
jgi:hypothetical protein